MKKVLSSLISCIVLMVMGLTANAQQNVPQNPFSGYFVHYYAQPLTVQALLDNEFKISCISAAIAEGIPNPQYYGQAALIYFFKDLYGTVLKTSHYVISNKATTGVNWYWELGDGGIVVNPAIISGMVEQPAGSYSSWLCYVKAVTLCYDGPTLISAFETSSYVTGTAIHGGGIL